MKAWNLGLLAIYSVIWLVCVAVSDDLLDLLGGVPVLMWMIIFTLDFVHRELERATTRHVRTYG